MFTRRYTNFWDGLFRPSKTHILGSGEVKTLTNLLTNGDFSNGETGWSSTGSTLSATGNTLSVVGTGTHSYASAYQATASGFIDTHRYLVAYRFCVANEDCIQVYLNLGGRTVAESNVSRPIKDQWYTVRKIVTLSSPLNNAYFLRHQYANEATANGKVMEVQYVSCVDLTTAFGAGNEPTTGEIEKWIATQSNSWFDTTAEYLYNTNQWF